MKLYLGCAQPPFHQQHLEIMGNVDEWTWVDLYVDHPNVRKWNATDLSEVDNNSCEAIYASHLLEHLPQVDVPRVLRHWYDKLQDGGKLILNVPDMTWLARRVLDLAGGKTLDGYYTDWTGEHGLMNIVYGAQSHEGEYHKSGFHKEYLEQILRDAGFQTAMAMTAYDAHDMGIVFAEAYK